MTNLLFQDNESSVSEPPTLEEPASKLGTPEMQNWTPTLEQVD